MLTIENRAGVDVLVMGNGCRPASEAESAFYAEITRLRAEIDLVIAQREAWRVSALTCQRSSAEFAANADRLRADVEALRSLVEVLAQHDSYSTEYDGRMIALCPDCGGQDGTHTTGCVFVRAKAHIDAAPAAPQQAESALNERVGLAYKNGYEEALNDCIRNGGEAWARSMFANNGEHIKPQQAEPVAWVEVLDRDEGPYEFHGQKLLPRGKHSLYLHPPAAEVQKLRDALDEIESETQDVSIQQIARKALEGK